MIYSKSPHENNIGLLKVHLDTKGSKIIGQWTSTLIQSMQKSRIFSQANKI